MKRLNRFLGSLRKRFQEARRKFSLWEPLLRYRARAAVRSSGAARQDARVADAPKDAQPPTVAFQEGHWVHAGARLDRVEPVDSLVHELV